MTDDKLGPLPEHALSPFSVGPCYTADQLRAERERCYALGVAQERERMLALARSRTDYEAKAAAHHAGSWHVAHEHHMTRYSAMSDLIDAIQGEKAPSPHPA